MLQDVDNRTMAFTFDLTTDDAPLTVGLDIQQFSSRDFAAASPTITFNLPHATMPRTFPIYITGDNLTRRAHLDLIGLRPATSSLYTTSIPSSLRPPTLAKRIHRYSHAPAMEMADMLARTGCSKETAFNISKEIVANCIACQKSGPPQPSKKLSLFHICEAHNQEIQTDFMYVEIREAKYCVLHVVDTGTAFSKTAIASKRSAECMATLLESIWIHRHGAPVSLSADAEFAKTPIR